VENERNVPKRYKGNCEPQKEPSVIYRLLLPGRGYRWAASQGWSAALRASVVCLPFRLLSIANLPRYNKRQPGMDVFSENRDEQDGSAGKAEDHYAV
jgi:hypothetical protein